MKIMILLPGIIKLKITTIIGLSLLFSVSVSSQVQKHPSFLGSDNNLFTFGKSTNIPGIVLDSVCHFSFFKIGDTSLVCKYVYKNDANGNRILAEYMSRKYNEQGNLTDSWTTWDKYQYKYDNNGNLIQSLVKVADEPYTVKTIYSYDSKNILLREKYDSETDSTTTDWGYLDLFYNDKGKLKSEKKYSDHDTSSVEYIYENNGNLIKIEKLYKWEGNWNQHAKSEYEYDFNNLVMKSKDYYSVGGPVFLGHENKYTYNTSGKLTSLEEFAYNFDGSELRTTKASYEYDENGYNTKITEKIFYKNNWKNYSYKAYKYDAFGKLLMSEEYLYDDTEVNWKGTWKIEYNYKSNYLLESYTNYYFDDNKWKFNYRAKYYYSNTGSNVNLTSSDNDFKPVCYIGPDKNINVLIDYEENFIMRVYSSEGKLVLNNYILHSGINKIPLGNAKSGIYIININNGKNHYSQKLLIK